MVERMTTVKKILLSLIPVAFVALNLSYLSVLFPLYSGPPGYDQDPAYAYLFNGLLILDGQAPWHVDHPGTPLQFICAGVVLLIHAILMLSQANQQSHLIDSVLLNPEAYLYGISCVLLLMNAGALYYFGHRVCRATSKMWLAIFCQLSGVSFAVLTPRAAYVAPEALLLFASYCLLGLLTPNIFKETDDVVTQSKKLPAAWIALVCGFGLSVKVTFLPMFGLIFAVRPLRKALRIIAFACIIFLIFLIPIANNLDRMFGWLWSVARHSGIHGSGRALMMDWSQLTQNLRSVLNWYALLYGVMAILFLYLVVFLMRHAKQLINALFNQQQAACRSLIICRSASGIDQSLRIPFLLVVVIAAQTMLVLKHPGAHYLIPVLPLAYVGFAWLLNQANRRIDVFPNKNKYRYGIGCFAVLFALYGLYPTVKQLNLLKAQRAEQNNALLLIDSELEKYPDALTICAFRCTTFKYAVAMGLLYAGGLSSRPVVQSLLNHFYEYNFLVRQMIAPGVGSFPLSDLPEQIKKHEKVFLITPKNYPELEVFNLETVTSTKPLMLYEIKGLSKDANIRQSHDQTN